MRINGREVRGGQSGRLRNEITGYGVGRTGAKTDVTKKYSERMFKKLDQYLANPSPYKARLALNEHLKRVNGVNHEPTQPQL